MKRIRTKHKSHNKKQNIIQQFTIRVDTFQRKHSLPALLYGIVKKFSEDSGSYLAALITYYGFLSIFPLLIVATAIIQFIAQKNEIIREKLLASVTSYFPAIGDTLATSLQTSSKTGIAMIIGLLIALYGARGVADAVQNAIHTVWETPRYKRAGFPKSTLKSIAIIIGGGAGLMLSAVLTNYATNSDLSYPTKIVVGTFGFITLFGVFWGVFTFGSSARRRPIANVPGALISALGVLLMQSIGSYLIQNQLNRYNGLNAQFAIVLVLLFWIYLQAQIIVLSLEYSSVRAHRLYPRSIDSLNPTDADKRAYELHDTRDNYRDT